uniref:DNA damage-regulated autophagy modulator protein 1 n=1 Tax=Parastrongyloides trichosuri TaxID=131310 RepID=A0A0N4Z5Z7_PARTI
MVKLLRFGRLGAGHIPIIFGIVFSITLGFTYCLSVYYDNVDPWLPYISSSGDERPESCIFSFLLNICAFMCMLIIYLRYKLITQLNREQDDFLKKINELTFSIGMIASLSMMIVANFQQTAEWTIHITAAVICFSSSVVYMCMDAFVTRYMYPTFNGNSIANVRIVLSIIAVISLVCAIGFGFAASAKYHSVYPDKPTPRPWDQRKEFQPGYNIHCVSAFFEWFLAFLIMLHIVSFTRDFEIIHVRLIVEALVSHLDHEPIWTSSDDLATRIC